MENLLCESKADICLLTPILKTITSLKKSVSLSDCIKNINCANLTNNILSKFKNEEANDILLDPKTLEIAQLLAEAIDKNSVLDVKKIKTEYADTKEFVQARKILEQKCKQLWNPYETKNKNLKIPIQAMKTLGISNQPSLKFLLEYSIKYFEQDNKNTTSSIISSILNNKNMNYSMEDIHIYLKNMNKKEKCSYNINTVQYLIIEHNYTKQKLLDLGVNEILIQKALKSLNIKNKVRYFCANIKQ